MSFPVLDFYHTKPHWNYSDKYGDEPYEYIKFFLQNNYTIGYHTHSFYELNIVLSGEGYHYIDQMPRHASQGSVFLIPPHIQHGYISKNDLTVYHMLIHRDFLENCFSEFRETEGYYLLFETEPYLRAHYQKNIFLRLSGDELHRLELDIDMMKECKGLPDQNIYINAIAKKILCFLCMLFTKQSGADYDHLVNKKDVVQIVDCLNYVHKNLDEPLTIEQLAKMLNMSRSTFIRQFTKICGCSPHQYIQRCRVKKAKEYLSEKNQSPSQVAQMCGFYDVSHMRKYVNLQDEKE